MEFQLLIKPVSFRCNSSCAYCFYLQKKELFPQARPMNKNILERMVEDFLKMKFSVSVFCWQGGEPTLAGLDFFQEVVRIQQKFGEGGQWVSNSLQTNGILLDKEWMRFLKTYRFFVGLSLDGPEKLHDYYRGEGTHRQVMRALRLLKDYAIEFNILCVLTQQSEGKAKEIFSFFQEEGIHYLQFIPCMEWEDGKIAPYSISPEGYADFLLELFELWWKERDRISIRLFDAIMEKLLTGKTRSYCTLSSSCGGYLVVEHDGSVYPCDFYVEKKLRLGNIRDLSLGKMYNSPLAKRFFLKKRFLDPLCFKCEWLNFCYGGCPKYRRDTRGNPLSRSIFCLSYRRFFSQTLDKFARYAGELKEKEKP